MVQVRFWLKFHVDYGQTIRIIGGHDACGECQPARLVQSRRVVGGCEICAMLLVSAGVAVLVVLGSKAVVQCRARTQQLNLVVA